ncbi:MAG: hypothetical protein ABEJ95_06275 [Candidatus Nanohalobium sp.]
MKKKLEKLTPIGRTHQELEKYLEQNGEKEDYRERYEETLSKYRKTQIIRQTTKLLLYASLITSFAATFQLDIKLIEKIASYIGLTLLLAAYTTANYTNKIYREELHLHRNILINQKNG